MVNFLIQLRIDDKLKAEAAVKVMREMSKAAEANGIAEDRDLYLTPAKGLLSQMLSLEPSPSV